ncbi:MAG: hypothetical protein A2X12_04835 [Bacteroidetes bacterium GWE2_29_8]|nr:MAG: hypothetical protein A2X12_04835 [Bacteroidetes bacterium GWE2_29_8]OFY24600.1 MAG: hypothetical protein A2X02_03300 [Bacteroidetes bacterium GWF2_29_10]
MILLSANFYLSHIIAYVLVGLGFFFIGLKFTSNNLKQLSSKRFRKILAKTTDNKFSAAGIGVVSGAVLQENTPLVYILTGMVRGGLLTNRKAFPIINWSNVGSATIIFLTVFNIELAAIYLLGITSLSVAFEKPKSAKVYFNALFGIALLLYGIILIRENAAKLLEFEFFKDAISFTQNSYLLPFVIGVILTMVTQSTIAITLIAIAFVHTGVLQAEQTMMLIYGCHLGVAFLTPLFSSGLKGSAKHIVEFQDLFLYIGSILFFILFYIEIYLHVPLVKALVEFLSDNVQTQMAFVYLIYNLTTAIIFALCYGRIEKMLNKHSPPTTEEDMSKSKYINEQSLEEPEIALQLVEKEQNRLIDMLPVFVDSIREVKVLDYNLEHVQLNRSYTELSQEISQFLSELVQHHPEPETSMKLINISNRQDILISIGKTLHEFVDLVKTTSCSEKIKSLFVNLIESIDLLFLMTKDASDSMDIMDIKMVLMLSEDRGEVLEKIRKSYLSTEIGLSLDEKSTLLYLTSLFERMVWMVNRYNQLLKTITDNKNAEENN